MISDGLVAPALIAAALHLVEGQVETPPAEVWFREEASARGLRFEHATGHAKEHLMPEISAGGAAWLDFDSDGDLDAYFVQGGVLGSGGRGRDGAPNQLFRNLGDGRFEDVTAGSGAEDRRYGSGVATGDYDADGRVDLYVTNVGRDSLLRNLGDGRFLDVTEAAGLGDEGWGSNAAFVDLDRDGDLDLVVTRYVNWSRENAPQCFDESGRPEYCSPMSFNAPARDLVYRNVGDGTFEDISQSIGFGAGFGNGFSVVPTDVENDGWPDLFIANDGMPDQFWGNERGERLRGNAVLLGVAVDLSGKAKAGMGAAAADLDGDGAEDLLVGNMVDETDSLYRNAGGYFEDQTAASGLAALSRPWTRFGIGFADFDRDGFLDLFEANGKVAREGRVHSADPYAEPNLLLRGRPDLRFEEVEPRGGTEPLLVATSRAAAFGDFDNDGRVDVLVVNRDGPAHLLHNVAAGNGGWIGFKVVTAGGRDALGARLRALVEGRWITRFVRSAYSFQAANDPRVHIGLGDASTIERVEVHWPHGPVSRPAECFAGMPDGRYIELVEGRGSPCPESPLPGGAR